jgi:hypothetical protein
MRCIGGPRDGTAATHAAHVVDRLSARTDAAPMTLGDEPRRLMTRARSAWAPCTGLGEGVYGCAVVVTIGAVALISLGSDGDPAAVRRQRP